MADFETMDTVRAGLTERDRRALVRLDPFLSALSSRIRDALSARELRAVHAWHVNQKATFTEPVAGHECSSACELYRLSLPGTEHAARIVFGCVRTGSVHLCGDRCDKLILAKTGRRTCEVTGSDLGASMASSFCLGNVSDVQLTGDNKSDFAIESSVLGSRRTANSHFYVRRTAESKRLAKRARKNREQETRMREQSRAIFDAERERIQQHMEAVRQEVRSFSSSGPVIEELSDDEDEDGTGGNCLCPDLARSLPPPPHQQHRQQQERPKCQSVDPLDEAEVAEANVTRVHVTGSAHDTERAQIIRHVAWVIDNPNIDAVLAQNAVAGHHRIHQEIRHHLTHELKSGRFPLMHDMETTAVGLNERNGAVCKSKPTHDRVVCYARVIHAMWRLVNASAASAGSKGRRNNAAHRKHTTTPTSTSTTAKHSAHLPKFVIGVLFRMQHGIVLGHETLVPSDKWLETNLPSIADMPRLNLEKKFVSSGARILLEMLTGLHADGVQGDDGERVLQELRAAVADLQRLDPFRA